MTHYVLLLAGGQGTRLKDTIYPKQFLNIDKQPMLMHSIKAFNDALPNAKLYVGLQETHKITWKKLCQKYNFNIAHKIYLSGPERCNTVFQGLKRIHDDVGSKNAIVLIHDAARPFITTKFISRLLTPFEQPNTKAVIPVINLKQALLERKSDSFKSVNRGNYLFCQTPQCFNFSSILKAYQNIMLDLSAQQHLHDDLMVFQRFFNNNKHIELVEGLDYNIKITTNLDYFIGEQINSFLKK